MISKEDIEHLKDLARVEFGKEETEKLAHDLGEILGYVEKLKKIDASDVADMTNAVMGVKNIFRKDDLGDSPRDVAMESNKQTESASALIDAFPEKHNAGHGTYLKVKLIL